jgi:hypothetical protein
MSAEKAPADRGKRQQQIDLNQTADWDRMAAPMRRLLEKNPQEFVEALRGMLKDRKKD